MATTGRPGPRQYPATYALRACRASLDVGGQHRQCAMIRYGYSRPGNRLLRLRPGWVVASARRLPA
jgi:hypothetical protein